MQIEIIENFSFRWENPTTQRYYRAIISKDMFNTWIVSKVWGGIGKASGRAMHVPCNTLTEAYAMIKIIDRARTRRGYIAVSV